MTVVARLLSNEFPILLGDLLVSGHPVPGGKSLALPTVRDIKVSPTLELHPKGLRQKLALVGTNIALGYTGDCSVAADFVNELEYRNEAERFSSQQMREFLDARPESMWKMLGIVGMLLEPYNEQQIQVFEFHRAGGNVSQEMFRTRVYGEVLAMGSGAHALRNIAVNDNASFLPNDGRVSKGAHSVSVAFNLAGLLLFHEMATGWSVENCGFGGGYELAAMCETGLTKIDNVSIFWRAVQFDSGRIGVRRRPQRILHTKYVGDLLIIRNAEFTEDSFNYRTRNFLVLPVHRNISDYPEIANNTSDIKLEIPDFRDRLCCHHVMVHKEDQQNSLSGVVSMVMNGARCAQGIQIVETGNCLEFVPSDDFFELLRRAIESESGAEVSLDQGEEK